MEDLQIAYDLIVIVIGSASVAAFWPKDGFVPAMTSSRLLTDWPNRCGAAYKWTKYIG